MKEAIAFGIYHQDNRPKRVAARIHQDILDLYSVASMGLFDHLDIHPSLFENNHLNDFISLGKEKTNAVRKIISTIDIHRFTHFKAHQVNLAIPIKIGDYTDFYSSEQHAYNAGVMFRDPDHALLPNWKHLPVAYHGRSSSIFVSGQNFHRPKGQINHSDTSLPVFSPTRRLDMELEMAAVIGKANSIGHSIPIDDAESYVFGLCLLNDWSARDIQRWEYVPLGPFLSKNFFTSISPWIIPIEELESFRIPAPQQIPDVLPYLQEKDRRNFDITLEVYLQTKNNDILKITTSNFKYMYWTVAQQIAHHTVNGCNLSVGDLLGSGTISGPDPGSYGSFLEITWGGKKPIHLPDGSSRTFLEDGDTIIIKGYAQNSTTRVDFGELRTTILPSI